jgi:hypothetical protein
VWERSTSARAPWITVPFLEQLKLFEMPIPGFFGFPPFAVECFVLWQALVVLGVAVPRSGRNRPVTLVQQWGSAAVAAGFCLLVARSMDSRTVGSLQPRLTDLGVSAGRLQAQGFDAFRLAAAQPAAIAQLATVDEQVAAWWVERARLATARGIGAEGVRARRREIDHQSTREPNGWWTTGATQAGPGGCAVRYGTPRARQLTSS